MTAEYLIVYLIVVIKSVACGKVSGMSEGYSHSLRFVGATVASRLSLAVIKHRRDYSWCILTIGTSVALAHRDAASARKGRAIGISECTKPC